jgi:hypothetical protein
MRREFMQRLPVVLHGTLGSCLRDALQEGGAAAVAYRPAPRSEVLCDRFIVYYPLVVVDSTALFLINIIK